MSKAFTTWTFGGVRMLAIPADDKCIVIDENGGNYGRWQTVERFRERQRAGDDVAKPFSESRAYLMHGVARVPDAQVV
jgi:hypothetical protein